MQAKTAAAARGRNKNAQMQRAMKMAQKGIGQSSTFSVTITNTATTSSTQVGILWNPYTFVTGTSEGAAIVKTASITYANLNSAIGANPALVLGFQYQADSISQLSNNFNIISGNYNGDSQTRNIGNDIAKAKSPTYQIDDLLYIPYVDWVSGFKAWEITVNDGEAITLIFDVLIVAGV